MTEHAEHTEHTHHPEHDHHPEHTHHPEHDHTHDEPDAPVQPDPLTGASPDVDEIAAADPDREGEAGDPYALRSGIETSPSEDDPGSMLNR